MSKTAAGSADRHDSSAPERWVLLTGSRLLVSLVILLVIGLVFVTTAVLGLATVTTPSRVMWYLNGTVNGLLTLVPIAVGVNQIVLTHEFGSIQDLYQRRTDVTEFRERVEQYTEDPVTSSHASDLFATLLAAVSDTAAGLHRECADSSGQADERPIEGLDEHLTEEIDSISHSIHEEATRMNDELTGGDPNMLRTLLIVLEYDDSRDFDEVRRLRHEVSDTDEDVAEQLQRIEELLSEIDAARQYLKTVVVERQLAQLSRLLIYTGLFSVTVALLGIFTYRDIAGVTAPYALLVVAAGLLVVTTLLPLAILSAYILRVATIARQTAAFGPFVPESE
ncbi:hypothetical protein ACFQDG_00460 [Natronoarchaeum mannanilyticum]|uniref:DUF4239 domain-containing protein n=1 Tax=Natronoarchaeum mannanilyticum TaxID=926360 RepID=A0AAV3TEQ3_9EURY